MTIKSDYAIILSCTANYLPGLNALLNSLDLYGNTADIWIIDNDLPEDYKKNTEAAFIFPVNYVSMKDLMQGEFALEKGRDWFYYCVFSLYVLQLRLRDKYKATATFGADVVVTNNLMRWFEVAEKTGYIVTCGNPYTSVQPEFIPKAAVDPNGLLSVAPVSDFPLFIDPNKHYDLLFETLNFGKVSDRNLESFNSAVHKLNKGDQFLILNSQQWTCGLFYLIRCQLTEDGLGRPLLLANDERVTAVHKKYWTDRIIYSALYDQIPGTWGYECTLGNTKIWSHLYRYFNTKCKIKYDYPENKIFQRLVSGELQLKCQELGTCK